VGFLLGSPLDRMLTGFLAVPVLVLLALFGLLVVTATPLHQVPHQLGVLRDRLLLRPVAVPDAEPVKVPRQRRKPQVPVQEDPADLDPVVVSRDEPEPAPPVHTPVP